MGVTETSEDVDNSVDNCTFNQKFYNPICLTGYLTPLQRKKLREKRNYHYDDDLSQKKLENAKKVRGIKRKKEHSANSPSNDILKKKKTKERIPLVQCTAAKIISKTISSTEKDKKFFKTSSHNRLERANFTMPLVFKKNVFLNINKCVKETWSFHKKPLRDKFCNVNNSLNFDQVEDAEGFKPNMAQDDKKNSSEGLVNSDNVSNGSDEHILDSANEESIFDFDWPSDEVLLKRQEKARAIGRELNHLKRSDVQRKENNDAKKKRNSAEQQVKFYPIFHTAIKKQEKSHQDPKGSPKCAIKRRLESSSGRGGEQMIIDAGQREIGAKICKTCNMVYTIGHEEDERLHSNFHDMYLINLKFPGWKEENVIGEYGDGRVIMVRKEDKSGKMKKIEDILVIANRDLGFPSSAIPDKPHLTFVLFISSTKQVVGCVIAEPISSACQVLSGDPKNLSDNQKEKTWRIGNWYSSTETVPAICGINRIWVAHSFRRQKVASRMIDCLRCNFIHGHVVGIRELAFTDPSPDGRDFAASYTGTDSFLVYR